MTEKYVPDWMKKKPEVAEEGGFLFPEELIAEINEATKKELPEPLAIQDRGPAVIINLPEQMLFDFMFGESEDD